MDAAPAAVKKRAINLHPSALWAAKQGFKGRGIKEMGRNAATVQWVPASLPFPI